MINPDMRTYTYYLLEEKDAYGQPQMSEEEKGQIKMAIYSSSKSAADNVMYENASYIGFTHANIDDSFIIEYGKEKLKVLYVIDAKWVKEVFLAKMV